MEKVYDIGSRREVFWDDYLIESRYTTAEKKLHHPIKRELVMKCDKPWEGDNCYFFNILKDGDLYRMYYTARRTPGLYPDPRPGDATRMFRLCYAESHDGLHWEKPSLGICNFEGSTDNNIFYDLEHCEWYEEGVEGDALFVVKDDNPACPPEERYKGFCGTWKYSEEKKHHAHTLKCLVSSDGIHFHYGWDVYASHLFFDSLNTFYYDKDSGKYICYFRGWHSSNEINEGVGPCRDRTRDIRRMESLDCKTWSEPTMIDFGESAHDFHQYINNIQQYPRAPHLLVGFPGRYVDRYVWSDNYDQLCGKDYRQERMKIQRRFGLAVTDGMFIFSRDGIHFERPNEAFLRPEVEHDWGWCYGDCYISSGLMTLPSDLPGAAPELSMLVPHRSWIPVEGGRHIYRYSIRADGFISRSAGYEEKTIVTKPFRFEGDTLLLNFETSAVGYIKVEILDKLCRPIEGYTSCEIFGNTTDRKIGGFRRRLADMNGFPIRLKITMSDADVYSFKFEKTQE